MKTVMVTGPGETGAHLGAPFTLRARRHERVAHRGQLVLECARAGRVERGLVEIGADQHVEPGADRAACRGGVTTALARRGEEERGKREAADHRGIWRPASASCQDRARSL